MGTLLERLTEFWADGETSHRLYKDAVRFEKYYELRRKFRTARSLATKIDQRLNRISKLSGLIYKNPCLAQVGQLFPQHRTISAELELRREATPAANFGVGLNYISGSGDAFSEAQAKCLATLELAERISFQLGKNIYGFSKFISFDQGSLRTGETDTFSPLSTSGFALEATPLRAAMKAAFEVVERDAFLCHWYTQIPPARLKLKNNRFLFSVAKRAEKLGLAFHAFELETEFPDLHVVYVTVNDPLCRNSSTSFCSGLACDQNIEQAFLKAYFEMDRFLGLHAMLNLQNNPIPEARDTPIGRFYYYLQPQKLAALDVFLSEREQSKAHTLRNGRETRFRRLLDEVRVYPGPVFKGASVFTCLAQVPHTLHLNYDNGQHLDIERLKRFAAGRSFTINSNPHPLP